jgi:hypothetical protein
MSYTTSQAQAALGIVISIGPRVGTASPTYVPIFELDAAPTTGFKWDVEMITNFNSPNATKEKLKTLVDPGKVQLSGNRVSGDAGQLALKAAFLDPANAYLFKITYPLTILQTTTGDIDTFNALVTQFDNTRDLGKAMKISVELDRTGAVTFTAGA